MAEVKRARRWMATVFFPEDNEYRQWWETEVGLDRKDAENPISLMTTRMMNYSGPEIVWIKGQVEICPSTGRFHVQVAMEYKHATSRNAIQDFWKVKCHAESIKQDTTGEYGCKEETRCDVFLPIRWGKLPESKETQGRRNDCIKIREMILSNAPILDILMEVPSGLRMIHHIEKLQDMLSPRREDMTELYIIVGPGGTGKSHWARANNPGAYWLPPGDHYKWWDNYRGEDVVIIDEFEPRHMSFSKLKRLVDKYPLSVEKKGSSTNFVAKKLYLINNHDPRDWYPVGEIESEAWTRRVTGVCWVEKLEPNGIFNYNSWDEFCKSRPRVTGHIVAGNVLLPESPMPAGRVPGFQPYSF